jgi:hypothetical protein
MDIFRWLQNDNVDFWNSLAKLMRVFQNFCKLTTPCHLKAESLRVSFFKVRKCVEVIHELPIH